MSAGAPAAADVPSIFDVLINGQGYQLLRTVDTSLPFRTQRASYAYTPTFLERQNVTGAYSDNQQDFFLTVSQNNWVGGEGQRFAHVSVPDSMLSVWRLDNVKVSDPGKVSLLQPASSFTTGGLKPFAGASDPTSNHSFLATVTTLYNEAFGSASSNAHSLGTTPTTCAHDGAKAYLSATAAGTVGVRTGDASGALTTFSATASDVLCFHNNSLYGLVNSTGILQVYSTAGVASTVYQFKRPDGSAAPQTFTSMISFGGKLLFVTLGQLWMFDGTGVSLLAQFPTNFLPNQAAGSPCMAVVNGVVAIGGIEYREGAAARPVVYYYTNGNIGKLWTSTGTLTSATCRVAAFNGGIVWNDDATSRIMFWDPATGAISSLFAYSNSGTPGTLIVANYSQLLIGAGASSGIDTAYLALSGTATSGSVTSSLYDFDNSLTKQMRGIKVDFDSAIDGNGGSVDIAYRVNDVDGSYTTLQSGAVSGTEYTLSSVQGRSISVKVTLNKGTSTAGPVLKRVYVRAAPLLQSFHRDEFILDLSGRDGKTMVRLNNNQDHPLDGFQQASNLITAIQATSPFTVVTRHASYTAVIEPGQSELIEIRPEEYIARIVVRGV